MFPQYNRRNTEGEIAIWLIITVGALLIPIIVIAICCIRHQLPRRPHIKWIETCPSHMVKNTKQMEIIRSSNDLCMELSNDNVRVCSKNIHMLSFSPSHPIKKQHVHWFDSSATRQHIFSNEPMIDARIIAESSASHLNRTLTSMSSSNHSRPITRMIIPVGSVVHNTGTSQLLTPTANLMSILIDHHSLV